MLSSADLHTYYGQAHILRGASLELPAGTALGLLGRNGMEQDHADPHADGLRAPGRRPHRLEGQDVNGWAPERMARLGIGYVPEGRGIFPNLRCARTC